jgi:hypothetical protein
MKKRFVFVLLSGLCLLLVGIMVASAKLPAGFAHTRGLYILFDNPDLGMNPPQLPVVGGVWRYSWTELEPTNGGFDWTAMDTWILRELERGKRAAIGFSFFNEYRSGATDRGIQIPGWVRTIDSGSFWLNTRRSPEVWYVPNYWNSTFRTYYQRLINAFAQHLVDNPTIRDRVAWVSLGAGLSGETQPSSRWSTEEAPDWYFYHDDKGITSGQWIEYVNWCSNMYKQAFSSRGLSVPLFLDIGPTYSGTYTERDSFAAYAASVGVGLRHNGLLADHGFAGNYNPMIAYWDTVPTAWESYQVFLPSKADIVWGILCGLEKHPDNFSFDKAVWETEEYLSWLQFAASYCGVRVSDTPGAWVGLRETQQPGGETGNYEMWLAQKNDAPNGLTVADWNVGQSRGYKFDVPNGNYQVDLYFAEVYYNVAGARVFDIKIENATVQSNYDIWIAAGGKNKPVVQTYNVTVSDGRIDIDFIQKTDNEPTIHAIKVTGPGYVERINCGGARFTDGASNVWVGDREYEAGSFGYLGGSKYRTTADIIGTNDDYLYQTMRIVFSGAPASGRFARRTDQATGNTRMRFDIDDAYMYNGNFGTVSITVTYFATGSDRWELRYDSTSGTDKMAQPAGSADLWVQKDNSGVWKRAVFYLSDARFANGQPGSTDFSIYCANDGNEWVSLVEVGKGGGAVITPTPTVTPVVATLEGTVGLEGRPEGPNSRRIVPLTVKIGATNYAATTNMSGTFTVTGITPGTYNICVKNSHTLSSLRSGVPLVAGTNVVNLGTLREGDGNNDDYITIVDFSVLASGYFPAYDARGDFNQDGYVNILDFSLLARNFGAFGECVGSFQPPQAPVNQAAAAAGTVLVRVEPASVSIGRGDVFTVGLQIVAGSQPVDGAEVHLDFDPRYLQVVDGDGQPAGTIEDSGMLENLLMNLVSVAQGVGHIDFAAGTLEGTPPSGTFTVATVRFKALFGAGHGSSALAFGSQLPRKTEVTFGASSVLGGTQDGFVSVYPKFGVCLPLVTGH